MESSVSTSLPRSRAPRLACFMGHTVQFIMEDPLPYVHMKHKGERIKEHQTHLLWNIKYQGTPDSIYCGTSKTIQYGTPRKLCH